MRSKKSKNKDKPKKNTKNKTEKRMQVKESSLSTIEEIAKTPERYPNLQTVLMVEKFIKENSGEYKKTSLFNALPKKMMWNTFQIIMAYLESINKIITEKDGTIIYIWNPELYTKMKDMPEIKI